MAKPLAAADLPKPDLLGEAAMTPLHLSYRNRLGYTLVEMVLLLSITGTLMVLTIRAFHLATVVHESGVQTASHLRLVHSLEDRLRADIARAVEAESLSASALRLIMPDESEVLYELNNPNVLERKTLRRSTSQDAEPSAAAVNQRWHFLNNYRLNIVLKPVQAQTLVHYQLRRSQPESLRNLLRDIEVSEVTHGR